MRYAFIKEHRGQWTVSLMARVLAVAVSGFYDWLRRGKSKRAEEDEKLTEEIIMLHDGSRCTYGSPRIHKDLEAAGHKVGRKRVARLMREAGIRGKAKRKYKTTTNAKHLHPKAENLVKQNFDVATPDTLWASDVTYVPTAEGWLYLAVTLDLFSRKVSLRGQKFETMVEADAGGCMTRKDGRTKRVQATFEIAFRKVAMTFEFERSCLVAPLTNQMRPGKRQGEQGYEFIQSLGRHVGVFEIKTT
jgi:hypothetical protein